MLFVRRANACVGEQRDGSHRKVLAIERHGAPARRAAEPRGFFPVARERFDTFDRIVRVRYQARIDAIAQMIGVAAVSTRDDR